MVKVAGNDWYVKRGGEKAGSWKKEAVEELRISDFGFRNVEDPIGAD